MRIINFSQANCKNCYKCLRHCPLKAIRINNDQAEILEERCISCGRCLVVCPQEARYIKSDIDKVKQFISSGDKVIASIAPSFIAAFDIQEGGQMVAALKKLGFYGVEETAIGAEIITDAYQAEMKKNQSDNMITTCCPAVNDLIEKYYPELIPYMIPMVSPMIAHGKSIRQTYGKDTKVVFIGPCVAKKYEAIDVRHSGIIQAVVTFDELDHWLKEEKIKLSTLCSEPFERIPSKRGRRFPIAGGIERNINQKDDFYEVIHVDGMEECIELLENLSDGDLHHLFIEMNICKGGCLNGPVMPKNGESLHLRQHRVKEYVKKSDSLPCKQIFKNIEYIDVRKRFFDRTFPKKEASEEEIKKILKTMGKREKQDELNCGACGYNTCREKAQAVFEGMSQMSMCMPYMRSKAESLTNIIFGTSPNIIFILDEEMNVKEFNPSAEKVFQIKAQEIKEKPITLLMDDDYFQQVKKTKQNLYNQKVVYNHYGIVVILNVLYLEKENIMLVIMNNITVQEKNKEELARVKEKTLNAAQDVIDKQMRVAQEIASLLGETTAETKVTLTKLKNIVMGEVGEDE